MGAHYTYADPLPSHISHLIKRGVQRLHTASSYENRRSGSLCYANTMMYVLHIACSGLELQLMLLNG